MARGLASVAGRLRWRFGDVDPPRHQRQAGVDRHSALVDSRDRNAGSATLTLTQAGNTHSASCRCINPRHGFTNKQIAKELFLTERTLETQVWNILNKLGFSSRTQIASWSSAHQQAQANPPKSREGPASADGQPSPSRAASHSSARHLRQHTTRNMGSGPASGCAASWRARSLVHGSGSETSSIINWLRTRELR